MTQSDRAKGEHANDADEEGGGLLPAIVVGAGILLVAALLIFDFGGSDKAEGKDGASSAQADGSAKGGRNGRAGKGGVESRPYDAAKNNPESRINPKVRLANVGMAPQTTAPPPEKPPVFNNKEEEIAWLEKKLASAEQARDSRKLNVKRLADVKARIESGPNPTEQLKDFEGRKKIVENNYDKAVEKVEELEAKIAELRG